MRKLLLTVLSSFIFSSLLLSQEFAPIGAKWYVDMAEPFGPGWSGTLINESRRDTMVKGLGCKVMYKSRGTIFNEIEGEYTLCQDGDLIYHYNTSLDSLNLVMDFGANVGDSWESFDQSGTYEYFGFQRNFKYVVDSISYLISENQDSLRIQHLSVFQKDWADPDSLYIYDYSNFELIERIGFRSALMPTNGGDGFTDDTFETDVRCYEDDIIGLIKLKSNGSCVLSSTNELPFDIIKIYPNPATEELNIEGISKEDIEEIRIFNEMGQLIGINVIDNRLEIGHLENGLYYIQIKNDNNLFTKKFVKMR